MVIPRAVTMDCYGYIICLLDVSRWEGSGICEKATRYKIKGITVNVVRPVNEMRFRASESSSLVVKIVFRILKRTFRRRPTIGEEEALHQRDEQNNGGNKYCKRYSPVQ